jgi:hypothetical protein
VTFASQSVTVQLPMDTKCTGGVGKNLCVASFITTAGFGNCVVVKQTNHVRTTGPAEDDEKKKGKGKKVDKAQGITADKRQSTGTFGQSEVSLATCSCV